MIQREQRYSTHSNSSGYSNANNRRNRVEKIDARELSNRSNNRLSSYTPNHWKNYILDEISHHSTERRNHDNSSSRSHKNYVLQTPIQSYEPFYDDDEPYENSRAENIINKRRQQNAIRQTLTTNKLKKLQQKVLPLISNQHNRQEDNPGWHSRIEQKLVHLEGEIQNMKNQFEIEFEKRAQEVEQKWEQRIRLFAESIE